MSLFASHMLPASFHWLAGFIDVISRLMESSIFSLQLRSF